MKKYIGKYHETPSHVWKDKVKFNWDCTESSQRFCFDDLSKSDFNKYYPNGLVLGFVNLKEFDKKLCHFSRRDEGELWTVGSTVSLSNMIEYLINGKPITPPFVKPLPDGKMIFQGGHNRYTVAKECDVKIIPILTSKEFVEKINAILDVNWSNPNFP